MNGSFFPPRPVIGFGAVFAAATLAVCVSSGAATASDHGIRVAESSLDSIISEMRLGVYYHDDRKEEGPDVNVEMLFQRPSWQFDNTLLQFFLTPRPHIGGTINTRGDTSQAYAGFTWDAYIFGPIFVEGAFGGSINDGDKNGSLDAVALGCHTLFHESASIGVDVSDNIRLIATIEHSSNASMCDFNAGLTNAGVRLGYKF